MCGAPPTGSSVSVAMNTSGLLSRTLDVISSIFAPRRVSMFQLRMLLMLLRVGDLRALLGVLLLNSAGVLGFVPLPLTEHPLEGSSVSPGAVPMRISQALVQA